MRFVDGNTAMAMALALAASLTSAMPAVAADVTSRTGADGTVTVTLAGRIGRGDPAALDAALREASASGTRVATVSLSSPGGDAAASLRLASAVLSAHLATTVEAGRTCASACFVVFAAGRPRSVGPGAVLGVHGVAVGGRDTPRGKVIDGKLATVLRDLGTPERVVAAMLATPPSGLYVLGEGDLMAMGVTEAE